MRVAVLLLFAALQAQLPPVMGVVVRAGTGEPVPHARVVLTRVDGELSDSRSARADERGRFTVTAVRQGRYRVFAHHDAYLREEAAPIALGAGTAQSEVRIEMTPTGTIAGRVLDEFGDPTPGIYVRAHSNDFTVETQTNDLGDYRLHSLPPGSYVVTAEPYLAPRIEGSTYVVPTPPGPYSRGEGRGMIPLGRTLQDGGYLHPMAVAGRGYARVYFQGVTEAAAATPIEVAPGSVVGGIDLRIATIP